MATLAAHAFHLSSHAFSDLAVLLGVVVPMSFSIALVGSAVWLLGAGLGRLAQRVAVWCLVGAAVLLAVGGVFTEFQRAAGGQIVDAWFVVVAQSTVGGLLGFLLGVYDSRRFETRNELLAERETADRLGRRLTVLNRVLRHDIRNCVNVIRGNAEIIRNGTDNPRTVAESIRAQASEMARLSEQAREIEAALAEDGIYTEPVDLGTAASGKALALQSRHGYASVHRSIDDAWVEASPLVEIAIEKLLENAIEHNDATEPSVWVEVAADGRDGRDVVTVRVEDDGPGIPPEEIDVLRRGRESALEHSSGLGLWLVHWIVSASGGEVHYEGREPNGSVVELVLPQADPTSESTGRGG